MFQSLLHGLVWVVFYVQGSVTHFSQFLLVLYNSVSVTYSTQYMFLFQSILHVPVWAICLNQCYMFHSVIHVLVSVTSVLLIHLRVTHSSQCYMFQSVLYVPVRATCSSHYYVFQSCWLVISNNSSKCVLDVKGNNKLAPPKH